MKDRLFATLQRVGRAFMLPIAILPVAGLFLGIGGSFTNETMLDSYGLLDVIGPGTAINGVLQVMNAAGGIIFANLPIIFAVAVALAMARRNKAVAALAGAIAFFVMHASIGAVLARRFPADVREACDTGAQVAGCLPDGSFTSVVGIESLQMGVFGGIIVGLGVAALHNRYATIELPQVLSFFGGERFVPIVSSVVYLAVGIVMAWVWPVVQVGINGLGDLVLASGYGGTLIYGMIERALIPFGLHHVFYLPFWQTSVGGVMEVCGQTIEGAQNIFFAQLGCPEVEHFSVGATRFMAGKFPFMIFGLPGAALAMYRAAIPAKQKVAGSLLLSAALTSVLTGITEPIEFTFLFVAPVLYVIHVGLAGVSFMLMHMLNVGVGQTFSGGLIDLTLFGILQGNAMTDWIWVPIVGVPYFFVYYAIFASMIKRFDYETPGREADDDEDVKLHSRADVDAKTGRTTSHGSSSGADASSGDDSGVSKQTRMAATVVKGLGGVDNFDNVDNCITRLRVDVVDGEQVDEDLLRSTGASGVMRRGNGVQVVYGPRVTAVADAIREYLEDPVDVDLGDGETVEASDDGAPASAAAPTIVRAPFDGAVRSLDEMDDKAFASGGIGPGVAMEPTSDVVHSPVDGEVVMLFPTKHAVGLLADTGAEILVHVGLDTVKMEGDGFEALVGVGDVVEAGTPLLRFDAEAIMEAGHPIVTPIVVTNAKDGGLQVVAADEVKTGNGLFVVL